jgi:DNA-binding CsgD family transcriptional regulator
VPGTAHVALSDRELQVFRMLGSSRSVKDIATELSLSPKTISTYRARICDKMGLRTSADFIRYVMEGGLDIRTLL